MIKDLEKEVVAIRNLLEVTSRMLLAWYTKSLGKNNQYIVKEFEREVDKYQDHRVARFEEEVEDALKVMKKHWATHGYEYQTCKVVPVEEYNKLLQEYKEIRETTNKPIKESGYVEA